MRAVFVCAEKIIMTTLALVALFAIVKLCFDKVCILTFRAICECLVYRAVLFVVECVGILFMYCCLTMPKKCKPKTCIFCGCFDQ